MFSNSFGGTHPTLDDIHKAFETCNDIKYAAYRTSSKIRIIQKILFMDQVSLKVIANVFNRHQLQQTENSVDLDESEIESIISDIYFVVQKQTHFNIEDEVYCKLMISLLLKIFDKKKKGVIPVLSCKVFLALNCLDKPREKYRYMFQQVADHNNCLSRKRLGILLRNLVSVIEYIGESYSFGTQLVPGTVKSCFKTNDGTLGISEENFISWLMQDPQLLVWLSTLYRIQISETVSHSARCAICKIYPIIGLRYRCLRCLSYDVCQICFFAGKLNKRHKLKHPVQEFCHPMTTSQSTKTFLLTLRNILYKKNSKLQYLPALAVDSIECESLNSTMKICSSQSSLNKLPCRELQSIILNLETASEKLIPVIETSCKALDNSSSNYNQAELRNCIVKYKFQIENQVHRLKLLRSHLRSSKILKNEPLTASTPVVNNLQMKIEKNKWSDHGLDAITPIRVVRSPYPPAIQNQKSEREFMWDNYDFGKCDTGISWEEVRSDTRHLSTSPSNYLPVVNELTENAAKLTKAKEENVVESLSTLLAPTSALEDSDHFSRRGFTWLRNSHNDDEVQKEKNESSVTSLKYGVKQILNQLHDLSISLTVNKGEKGDILYEVDREIEAAEKVDTLLRELMTGIERLIEV